MSYAILGNGVYSFNEAARLVGLSYDRVYAWFGGAAGRPKAAMHSDYEGCRLKRGTISFLDLVETLVFGRLRNAGLSMQYLRKVREALAEEFELAHPFCRENLLTDGKRVFIHVAEKLGEGRLRELLSGQYAFPEILLDVLKRIDYDQESFLARRWNIGRGVVIDPRRQYGKPIVASVGISTAVLNAAYQANDSDVKVVARWYGVTPRAVKSAVAFERQLGGAAA